MLWNIIVALFTGTLIGFGGRAILPGAQDIGLSKTIGLGVVANVVVSIIFSGAGFIFGLVVGSVVAAGLLWLAIRQGWLKA